MVRNGADPTKYDEQTRASVGMVKNRWTVAWHDSTSEASLKKIDEFREQGNSSAHTIELNFKKNDLEQDSQDIEYIIKVLVKVLDSI